MATEPVIAEEEQQQPSKDNSCEEEESGTANIKDVSTQNDDACSKNQQPDNAEPVDATTTVTTQVVQQQQSPKKLLLEKYQLCEGDQSSAPSPTHDDAENLPANNKDDAVKVFEKTCFELFLGS